MRHERLHTPTKHAEKVVDEAPARRALAGEIDRLDRRQMLAAEAAFDSACALEKEGLLSRDEPIRGRVGQPSVPMRLNADAVFSFGVKIGRRSADLVLMDFVGVVRMQLHQIYPYPLPQDIIDDFYNGPIEPER